SFRYGPVGLSQYPPLHLPKRSSRGSEPKRNGVKGPPDRRMENGVTAPRMDMTLAELQEMAARQQQQIESQQHLLATKEQREAPEGRLKKVRALKGQVEQKRLSNGKLVEEIEQMNSLFQQKQRELVVAVSKVDELSRQLDMLKNGKMDTFHDNQSSLRNKLNQDQNSKLQQQRDSLNKRNLEVAAMDKRVSELRDRLWKKKAALQHKENLPPQHPGHSEQTSTHNGYPAKERASKETHPQLPSEGPAAPQQSGPSRVAAVGPYIQSSTVPRGPAKHELLVKPAYPDGTTTLPGPEPHSKTGAGLRSPEVAEWGPSGPESNANGHGLSSTLPRMPSHAASGAEQDDAELKRDRKVRPFSMFEPTEPPAPGLRKNQSSEDLARDAQAAHKPPVKVPPPVPTKPKGPNGAPYIKPGLNTGTFPKAKPPSSSQQQPPAPGRLPLPATQSHTLPLPSKQEVPPAATVRPFTPELPPSKPQTLAASSIYSMYTQQPGSTKPFQPSVLGALTRAQTRGNGFISVYGKPVISGTGPQYPENPYLEQRPSDQELDHNGAFQGPGDGPPAPETERTPRPLSPTKLLPFISNPYRHQSDGDLEALRKKLYNAPRPLKKRSSITEPEGPAGPNIQKLLYQKTTLAAMEIGEPAGRTPEGGAGGGAGPVAMMPPVQPEDEQTLSPHYPPTPPPAPQSRPAPPEDFTPPPPPAHPAPRPDESLFPPPPPGLLEEERAAADPSPPPPEGFQEEFPPYPPPPYPSAAEQDAADDSFNMKAPEVTGQVPLPPGKRTNLRKVGSERIDHNMSVEDPSQPNDEGITALHNAVCAGHTEIVKFLVQFGVNVNAADSDGW
ncbi:hypothetical protein NHX12_022865, partial [Muraenolepis orangiensis]